MRIRKQLAVLAFVGAALLLASTPVSANTIRYIFTGVTDLGGGVYQWDYTLRLENAYLLSVNDPNIEGDQFGTLYDIGSYVVGSAAFTADASMPAGFSWNLEESLLGRSPVDPLPPGSFVDRYYMWNVTWLYTGTAEVGGTGNFTLGTMSLRTTWGVARRDWASTQDHDDQLRALQGGYYQTQISAPEPSVLLLLGSGLLGIAGFGRSRRNR
jgi:hypothetical protein